MLYAVGAVLYVNKGEGVIAVVGVGMGWICSS